MAHTRQVCAVQIFDSLQKLRSHLGHSSLLKIITTEIVVLPWCWLVNHGQRSFKLQVQIVHLVKFLNKLLHETFVEYEIPVVLLTAFPDYLIL